MSATQPQMISFDDFRAEVFDVLNETFEDVIGMYLDKGDDLASTLEGVTAGQASRLTGSCGNSVASQLRHFNYYLEVAMQHIQGAPPAKVDWAPAWKQTTVTDHEWRALQARTWELREELSAVLRQDPPEFNRDIVGGAFAMVAHCAYHLGQIRHALCMTT